MARRTYEIHSVWDHDANIWVATSDDFPTLVAEADSCTRLLDELRGKISRLLSDEDDDYGLNVTLSQ